MNTWVTEKSYLFDLDIIANNFIHYSVKKAFSRIFFTLLKM